LLGVRLAATELLVPMVACASSDAVAAAAAGSPPDDKRADDRSLVRPPQWAPGRPVTMKPVVTGARAEPDRSVVFA